MILLLLEQCSIGRDFRDFRLNFTLELKKNTRRPGDSDSDNSDTYLALIGDLI